MRRNLILALALITIPGIVNSQINIPAGKIVVQDFNTIGSSATAALPVNWKMSSAGTGNTSGWATGTNVTATNQSAASGTPTTGGRYNWATTAGTDRAIGFMSDAGYNDGNAIFAFYKNTTGATVTSITISYSIERYRINTGSAMISLFSSTDGSTWTSRPAGDISGAVFTPGASAYTFTSPQTVYKTATISGISIANNADIYIRWVFNTGGNTTTSQGLALDDVMLYAATATPIVSSSLSDNLQVDVNNPGVDAGDQLRYTNVIRNTGSGDATGVNLNDPAPANTTLVPGSVKTSALARNDSYSTAFNTVLNGTTVLVNDFGLPALSVTLFGSTNDVSVTANGTNTGKSDNGGNIVFNTNGTFTYTPPTGFVGYDKFAYIASSGTAPDNAAVVTVAVGSAPATGVADVYNVIGNVSIIPNAGQGVLTNDGGNNISVSSVNGNGLLVGVATTTTQGGNLILNANGSFTYNPPKGFEGSDNFTYTTDNGFSSPSAAITVTLNVSGMIWFIDGASAAGGDGRLSAPFNSVAAFQAVNDGTGNNPAANDYIYVYANAASYTGVINLQQGQKLIGQNTSQTLAAITGFSVPPYSTALPVTLTGTNVVLSNNATIINLSPLGGNLLQGFLLTPSAGNAILLSGAASGNHTAVELVIQNGSAANGINLASTSYNGTFNYNSGNINSSGTGNAVVISNNAATLNCSVNIFHSGTAAMLNVSNHTTGVLTFSGTLTISSGTGLQFSNADGSYTFNGFGSLSGGDVGIDILAGSSGTFTFSTNYSIGNPTNEVIKIDASTANFTYGGTLQKVNNAATAITLSNNTGGTITVNGTVANNFNTQTANAVDLINNTGTTINFTGNNLQLTTTTGTALNATGGGTVNITGANNTITVNSSGTAVNISGTNAGASGINFNTVNSQTGRMLVIANSSGIKTLGVLLHNNANGSGALSAIALDNAGTVNIGSASGSSIVKTTTGTGISIINNSTLNITNAGMSLSTTTGTGVDIAGSTIAAGGATLSITSGGTAVQAIAAGTSTITGTNITVISTGGTVINVSTGTANFSFQNISASGGTTSAVSYVNAAGTTTISNGTITGNTAASFNVSGGSANITYAGSITQAANAEMVKVAGGHTGTLSFNTGTLSATNGTGLQFDNADGTYNFNSTTTLNGGDAGIDILNGSTGTFSFGTGTTITNPSGTAFNLSGATASNATVTYSGSITDNTGFAVDIDNHDANNITFQTGNITSTGTGIRVQNSNGGTISFNNPSKTLTTTTSTAVTLSANTGATINFASGGLAISTTSGTGFSATGGGTLTVTTGTNNNTIASTTGTALNIANTTIGAGGVTFRSIASSGGTATGIILDNTGATAGLTVTGDGSNTSLGGNSSGGIISNKSGTDLNFNTGCGIYLNNTRDVVLRRMTINGTNQNHGIRGFAVTNFTLEYSTVNGTNGTNNANNGTDNYGEGSLVFGNSTTTGITGTSAITSCLISGAAGRNLSVVNTSGTLNRITVTGCSFGLTQNLSGGLQSLAMEARNAGTILNATVQSCTFIGSSSDQSNFTGQQGTSMDVIYGGVTATPGTGLGNAVSNSHPLNNIGGCNLTLASQGIMTFNVRGNTFRDANGSAITFFKAQPVSGTPSITGTFDNNIIGVAGIPNSGSSSGNGIFVSAAGTGTMTYTITNNQIHQIAGNGHVYADNTGGSYTANFTIQGNTMDTPGAGWFAGIAITNGSPTSTDQVNVCARIGGPTAPEKNHLNFVSPNNLGIILGSSGANGPHTFNLPGYTAPFTEAHVESYVQGNNVADPGFTFTTDAYVDAPATFAAFTGLGTSCPLLSKSAVAKPALHKPAIEWEHNNVTFMLSNQQLNETVQEAISIWKQAGLDESHINLLQSSLYRVGKTAKGELGNTSLGVITISPDADGNGWFLGNRKINGPYKYADLLTCILHEMGHRLGLKDLTQKKYRNDIMYAYMQASEQRMPTCKNVKQIKLNSQ